MDNAQKAIMIGVGLFITILIISIVLLITNLGISTTKTAGESIVKISSSLQTQLITQYDRKTITGQDVYFAIDQNATKLANNIYLNRAGTVNSLTGSSLGAPSATPASPAVTTYYAAATGAGTGQLAVGALLNLVNTSAMYKGYLIQDANLNIVGLYFVLL